MNRRRFLLGSVASAAAAVLPSQWPQKVIAYDMDMSWFAADPRRIAEQVEEIMRQMANVTQMPMNLLMGRTEYAKLRAMDVERPCYDLAALGDRAAAGMRAQLEAAHTACGDAREAQGEDV